MSIIHDALKKAQQSHKEKGQNPSKIPEAQEKAPSIYAKLQNKQAAYGRLPEEKTQEQTALQVHSERKRNNIFFISLIVIFSLFIGIFLSFLAVFVGQNIGAEKAKNPISFLTKPEKEEVQDSGLALGGIMMMDDKHVALINGEIYELGEFVQGKKITNITLKSVELTENGKTIILDVHKKR